MTTRETIDRFLACKRIAIAGVSRNPKDFTRSLFNEFRRRGYDVIPVTPHAAEIDGIPCASHVQDVAPAPDAVLLMTSAAVTPSVVQACAAAGVRRIWIYRDTGCEIPDGMQAVAGECPFMFFPNTGLIHRIHGFFHRVA
jgi:acyl-CoA synthetase (NDP forming)